MSLRLVRAVAEVENADELHLGRLLILLRSADERKTTAATKAKAIEGITKLAKLDFLLRYPTCLERALVKLGKGAQALAIEPRERTSVETKMIRFRYGPWDSRYRRWLGLLSARGLVALNLEGNTVEIGLTDAGRSLADTFRTDTHFGQLKDRSDLIVKAVGAMTAMRLKEFVYEAVPEIVNMRWGEEITP
ncbi:MAG: hypothetical protein K2P94_16810 [Rhodospirillaceae bacterium]|nr:hypothetical protein [Rhodospirillaceae bacterium]